MFLTSDEDKDLSIRDFVVAHIKTIKPSNEFRGKRNLALLGIRLGSRCCLSFKYSSVKILMVGMYFMYGELYLFCYTRTLWFQAWIKRKRGEAGTSLEMGGGGGYEPVYS